MRVKALKAAASVLPGASASSDNRVVEGKRVVAKANAVYLNLEKHMCMAVPIADHFRAKQWLDMAAALEAGRVSKPPIL